MTIVKYTPEVGMKTIFEVCICMLVAIHFTSRFKKNTNTHSQTVGNQPYSPLYWCNGHVVFCQLSFRHSLFNLRRQGKARQGKARQGKARQGKARQGKARQGKARQGKARQGKARQGKARQGKARQGKARYTTIIMVLCIQCTSLAFIHLSTIYFLSIINY